IEEGAYVVLADIQTDLGRQVAERLGAKAKFVFCDVTSEEQVQELISDAVGITGNLDVMMNNAGVVGARAPVDEILLEEFQKTIEILVTGSFLGIKHAAAAMKEQESGSIINMASTAGLSGGFGPHAYATAKHAIVGLTRNTAAELCRYGIRVNCIAPSGVTTPLAAQAHLGDFTAMDEIRETLAQNSPLKGRAGTAEDVGKAALFLASDESGYTNGHCLTVDAGFTSGSKANDPQHMARVPFMREAGKEGLGD
ncbi:MAG: SDR family oxidoreductase, partial [Acidimicrobiales bacterium]|nr:SDR family oxidoreductase [Acidimicrobiales bacterium]